MKQEINIPKIIMQEYKEHNYRSVIEMGLYAMRQPMTKVSMNNIRALIAISYYMIGMTKQYVYWQQKVVDNMSIDDWEERAGSYGKILFALNSLDDISDDEFVQRHFMLQDIVKVAPQLWNKKGYQSLIIAESKKKEERKLRIGYISPELVTNVNMCFVIQLLVGYNRSNFEVYCYTLGGKEDVTSEFIKEYITKWCNISALSPEESAHKIYDDKIDILVDISIHSSGSRTAKIIAYKPAPIIIAGIGYMATSGINAVDYFLTDVYCDPFGCGDEQFSEKLLRLPNTHFCYTPMEQAARYSVNENIHQPIVFGSMNRYGKISDDMIECWKRILNRVHGSKLLMQAPEGKAAREYMYNRLVKKGFPMDMVEMRDPDLNYFATYNDMDIALDTYPYVGGGTTCDTLYMGVPLVTMYGKRHGTRFGYSLLKNIGLESLAVTSLQEYEDTVVALAENPDMLADLHKNIRYMLRNSPIMNYKQFVKSVEEKYYEVWQNLMENDITH